MAKETAVSKCRYHFPVPNIIHKLLANYKTSYEKRDFLLSGDAKDELKHSMNNPTELYYRLDPGNKRLFVSIDSNSADIFHQFISSMSTYCCDVLGKEDDMISNLWKMPEEDIKKYIKFVNDTNIKNCGDNCTGRKNW